MNSIYSNCGLLTVGDMVNFTYTSGSKSGKISYIQEDINRISVGIYCIDDTGGYTINVPHYNVTDIITEKEEKVEEIKKPSRYNKRGKLECWDVILDQEMNFLEGSVLKYLWRYKEKNGIHDLEKAKVYIDKIIEGLKK